MEHYENTVATRRIHEGRIINLREDTVEMPSGRTAKREIVEHKGAVCIVPVLNDGSVGMVRQFRKPAEDALLEELVERLAGEDLDEPAEDVGGDAVVPLRAGLEQQGYRCPLPADLG